MSNTISGSTVGRRELGLRRMVATLFAAGALLSGCDDSPAGPGEQRSVDPLRALAVGESHACLLTDEGMAHCWGANDSGQLGTGSLVDAASPQPVATDLRFSSIYAGGRQTCALTADGEPYCWGANRYGQLGTGGFSSEWDPQPVAGGLRFAEMSVGGFQHACGRTDAGDLYCWGGDRDGQLGYPPTETCPFGAGQIGCSSTPRAVQLGTPVVGVSAGFLHTCVLRSTGEGICWGENTLGQLGNGSTGSRVAPSEIVGGLRLTEIASGSLHGCGREEPGRVLCWGDDRAGALGSTGSAQPRPDPQPVDAAVTFATITAARGNSSLSHTCGTASDGRAYCWGANESGQLGTSAPDGLCRVGNATIACSRTPVPVGGVGPWSVLSAGSRFTCGLTRAGVAYCWGLNSVGQLGNGGRENSATPQAVSGNLVLPRAEG